MLKIIRLVYSFVLSNTFLTSFFAGIISEEIVIFLAILGGKGQINILSVFLGGLIGSFFMDQVYYFFGKSKFIEYLKKKHIVSKNIEKLPNFIKKFGERNLFIEILITKFIYGTRAPSILSIGAKKIEYPKFVLIDFLAILSWALIIIPIGFLAGMGVDFLLKFTSKLEKFIFISFMLVIFYFLIIKVIISNIFRKSSN